MAGDKGQPASQGPAESEAAERAGEMKELFEWFCDLSAEQVFWQPLIYFEEV